MKGLFLLNNRPEEWVEGLTVAELLKLKNYTFKMLVIKINGELIKKSEYDKAYIPESADVVILHLMSGG
ncbi:MAG: sulfur carrier protein ThiS [Candidatus Cloacimonetes bacterium]|nr:sulfur carrier protein ThiS [Candidatus Cloacimonadota bacterium]